MQALLRRGAVSAPLAAMPVQGLRQAIRLVPKAQPVGASHPALAPSACPATGGAVSRTASAARGSACLCRAGDSHATLDSPPARANGHTYQMPDFNFDNSLHLMARLGPSLSTTAAPTGADDTAAAAPTHNGAAAGHAPFAMRASISDEEAPPRMAEPEPAASTSTSSVASDPGAPSPKYKYKYKRVLLKISGEALQGSLGSGVDPKVLNLVAEEIAEAHRTGLELAVVVGGGNYFRGASAPKGMDRAQADYVGMLATVMNALLLQGALESMKVETRVQTAIEMREVAEPYVRRRAQRHLEEKRVVIFGAGTGNPFFTTDTAAALRAAEMNADVFMKATKVDGVYDCDPMKNQHAKKYDKLTYRQVSIDNLQVMDETAVTLCKENNIPVLVFNVMERGNVVRAALGHKVGTVVAGALTEGDDDDEQPKPEESQGQAQGGQ